MSLAIIGAIRGTSQEKIDQGLGLELLKGMCYFANELQLKINYIFSIWYLQNLTDFAILILTQLRDEETVILKTYLYHMYWKNGTN